MKRRSLLNLVFAAGAPVSVNAAEGDARRRRHAPGFTLIEIIVAVGAVALVAVGLASIFDSVGKTLSGGRRISHLNNYSLLLENVMRRDFENMTRDGFLVIRHQWVDADSDGTFDTNADVVPLHPDSRVRRPRRIDEITFFARGDFHSVRQPLSPEVVASSDVAMIYYGHGAKRRPSSDPTGFYLSPKLDDDKLALDSDDSASAPPYLGVAEDPANPDPDLDVNGFSANWSLLRQQTLLVKPESATQTLPTTAVFRFNPNNTADREFLEDKDTQIALQPAAASIFRAVNRLTVQSGAYQWKSLWREDPRYTSTTFAPVMASGLVDIATTDLNEVRAWVTGAPLIAGTPPRPVYPGELTPLIVGRPTTTAIASPTAANPNVWPWVTAAQLWMSDAFPAESNPVVLGSDPASRLRMRYEPETPDLLGVLKLPATSNALALTQSLRRADQLMLETGDLVPHCTEFIVEWSFGFTVRDPAAANFGETIWYGLDRRVDTDHDGSYIGEPLQAAPYVGPWDPMLNPQYGYAGEKIPGPNVTGQWTHPVMPQLIYGFDPVGDEQVLTSYFGYIDPTFNPDLETTNAPNDEGDAAVASIPWAWPKLIRVTVTLADPQNPEIESTFQFVFSAPPDPGVQ